MILQVIINHHYGTAGRTNCGLDPLEKLGGLTSFFLPSFNITEDNMNIVMNYVRKQVHTHFRDEDNGGTFYN